MTKWLSHQEACYHFADYLQWTIPDYIAKLTVVSESKEEDSKELEEDEVDGSDNSNQDLQLGYSIEKQAAYSCIKINTMVDDFGQPHTRLDNFKCFTIQLPPAPQVIKLVTKDVIHACRTIPTHGTSLAVPAQFDTVLARQSDAGKNLQHPLDGM